MAIVTSAGAGMKAAARATIIQLRAPDSPAGAIEVEARSLGAESPLPVVVSSRCDIALAGGAAGGHLPESDIPGAAARRLLGDLFGGRSGHSLESALRAERGGADYVIFGPGVAR